MAKPPQTLCPDIINYIH